MNTEFPRKKPAQPSTAQSTSGGSGSGDGRLPKVNNETTPVVDKEVKTTIASKFGKAVEVLNLINTSVVGIYKRIFVLKDEEKKNAVETKKRVGSIVTAINSIKKTWSGVIESIQRMTDDITNGVGSAMGEVFGSGLFGRTLGSIFSKVLSFAVSKILVGIVLANLPTVAIVAGVIAAIGALIYFAEEIWEGIKWLGMVFDQSISWLVDIFGKSKYTEARENLAKEVGFSEDTIREYYGDTVRGRDQMLEDYRKTQEDPKFKKELLEKIGRTMTVRMIQDPRMLNIDTNVIPASTIINNYGMNDDLGLFDSQMMLDKQLSLSDPSSIKLPTIVNNTTNNNSSVNTSFGKDISTFYPTSSFSLGSGSSGISNLQLSGF